MTPGFAPGLKSPSIRRYPVSASTSMRRVFVPDQREYHWYCRISELNPWCSFTSLAGDCLL